MRESTRQGWAIGGTVFAATMMLVIGVFQAFQGIAAIARDSFFVPTENYLYEIDTTGWGWIHLAIGVLLAITGAFLFTGAIWARVAGITIVAISAIANFFFIPYYPVWALLIIALDVFAIWAIATAGSPREAEMMGMGRGEMYAGEAGRTPAERWPSANEPAGRYEGEPVKETGRHAATGAGYADYARDEYAQDEAARRAAEEARRRTSR